jgi:replicative DNA helicase
VSQSEPTAHGPRILRGDQFILNGGDDLEPVWGNGSRIAWSSCEPLLIVGPAGVGKTTLAQNIVKARLGLGTPHVLGMPVEPSDKPLLYFAADRPRQIRRAFRRLFADSDRTVLNQRLLVHAGPPPFDVSKNPRALVEFATRAGVGAGGTIVLDSLKDMARDLSKDEAGNAINQALQYAVAARIETIALHHQRKAQADNRKPRSLADVYGSVWITAGAGSVVLLWGEAGDLRIELLHLKQPHDDIGPLELVHDPDAGTVSLDAEVDLMQLAQTIPGGLTAAGGASTVYRTAEPTRNQVEKVRRRLEALAREGQLVRRAGDKPTAPVIYEAAA